MNVGDYSGNRCETPPRAMPNSAACLIELVMSLPPLTSPTILARELCACRRKEAESVVPSGWRTLPTARLDEAGGIALHRMAEGVIRSHEEPSYRRPGSTIALAALAATA